MMGSSRLGNAVAEAISDIHLHLTSASKRNTSCFLTFSFNLLFIYEKGSTQGTKNIVLSRDEPGVLVLEL